MKFQSWLYRANSSVDYIRISKMVMNGSHNFPHHSRLNSLVLFCKKNNLSDEVKDALIKSFNDFEKLPYAVVAMKKREVRRI